MQEDHEKKFTETSTGSAAAKDAPPEATSTETLSEIEETEKVTTETGGADQASTPSPDGAIDSDQTDRNPKDDAGPM